jgi:SPP1 Gp6-like portal protein
MSVLDPLSVANAKPLAQRTPDDWLAILGARLDAQATRAAVPEAYYNGDHPLQFASTKFREAFGSLFQAFADNWCEIVVDAPVERLRVIGFRQRGREGALTDAWDIWQANGLDMDSVTAHTEAGKAGTAYLLVDPNDGDPRITVEHAAQMIVAADPGDRRRRLAALKRWQADDGRLYANVYLPEVVVKYEAETPMAFGAGQRVEWSARRDDAGGPNPLGVVPAIPLENRPTLLGGGVSDLKPAIPIQNAINKLATDLLVASEFGAFRQRVLTGIEIPRDPETGRPLGRSEIVAAMSRLWTFENPDAKVYDLNPTDLANFVRAIDMFRQDLAAQTRTPPHYLLGQVINASGDALKVAEAGLVSKCRRKILSFSDAWEAAMSLALKAGGIDAEPSDLEVLWANPERSSLGELVDASVKKNTLGVPLEVLWLEMGYTPEQVEDMKRMRGLPERPARTTTIAGAPPPAPAASESEALPAR